ncbi:hypothetical protein KAW38_02095 [Candidatus Micrarchaeota archaeon]|nr:hypothetical protein [Candidatus Micrarchaeota archaeon]
MELDDLLISTGVDALIKLLSQKKKVELGVAAKLLHLSPDKVEDWAHILETEGILKIEYHLTKVFLVWAEATPVEIEKRGVEFVRKKKDFLEEIKGIKKLHAEEEQQLKMQKESFSSLYSSLSSKFDQIDSVVTKAEGIKKRQRDSVDEVNKKFSALEKNLESLTSSMKFLESQIHSSKKTLEGTKTDESLSEIKNKKKEIEGFKASLEKIIKEIGKAKEMGEGAPSSDEIQHMKNDFNSLRSKLSGVISESKDLKTVIGDFRESSEIISSARKELEKILKSAQRLRSELSHGFRDAGEMKEKLPKITFELKKDLEDLKHVEDTVSHLKETFSQEDVSLLEGKIAELDKKESSLLEGMSSLEHEISKVSASEGGLPELQDRLDDLRDEILSEKEQLIDETEILFKSVEEEMGTYSTFQKIKEKARSSLEDYLSQLGSLKNDAEKIKEGISQLRKTEIPKIKEDVKTKELFELVDRLKKQKETLGEAHDKIVDMESMLTRINKNLSLLSKQAKLIEMRGGGVSREEEEGVRQSISLSKNETKEFEKKRTELKDLIRRLWEEG